MKKLFVSALIGISITSEVYAQDTQENSNEKIMALFLEKLVQLNTKFEELKTNIEKNLNSNEELKQEVSSLKAELQKYIKNASEVNQMKKDLESKIQELEKVISAHKTNLKSGDFNEKQVEEIISKMIEKELASYKTKQERLEEKIKDQESKLTAVYLSIQEIQKTAKQLSTMVSGLQTKVKGMEGKINEKIVGKMENIANSNQIIRLYNKCENRPGRLGDLYIYYQAGLYYPKYLKYAYEIAKKHPENCPILKKTTFKGNPAYRLLFINNNNLKIQTIRVFSDKDFTQLKKDEKISKDKVSKDKEALKIKVKVTTSPVKKEE